MGDTASAHEDKSPPLIHPYYIHSSHLYTSPASSLPSTRVLFHLQDNVCFLLCLLSLSLIILLFFPSTPLFAYCVYFLPPFLHVSLTQDKEAELILRGSLQWSQQKSKRIS